MKLSVLALLGFVSSEERENETFVVYPGGEEHTFTKAMVSILNQASKS